MRRRYPYTCILVWEYSQSLSTTNQASHNRHHGLRRTTRPANPRPSPARPAKLPGPILQLALEHAPRPVEERSRRRMGLLPHRGLSRTPHPRNSRLPLRHLLRGHPSAIPRPQTHLLRSNRQTRSPGWPSTTSPHDPRPVRQRPLDIPRHGSLFRRPHRRAGLRLRRAHLRAQDHLRRSRPHGRPRIHQTLPPPGHETRLPGPGPRHRSLHARV